MSEQDQENVVSNKPDKVGEGEETEHDPQYEPIISLPEVEVPTLEEDETELLNMRAKLYRYDTHENPPEWKERGTGVVKILHHKLNGTVRVVMRRDKTLKICANHYITPFMELKPSVSCERAWVYSVKADYADETPRSELLAIKFANIENAKKWKDIFNESKKLVNTNGTTKLDDTLDDDKKLIADNPPKLNDTFEDGKNCSDKNEDNDSDESESEGEEKEDEEKGDGEKKGKEECKKELEEHLIKIEKALFGDNEIIEIKLEKRTPEEFIDKISSLTIGDSKTSGTS